MHKTGSIPHAEKMFTLRCLMSSIRLAPLRDVYAMWTLSTPLFRLEDDRKLSSLIWIWSLDMNFYSIEAVISACCHRQVAGRDFLMRNLGLTPKELKKNLYEIISEFFIEVGVGRQYVFNQELRSTREIFLQRTGPNQLVDALYLNDSHSFLWRFSVGIKFPIDHGLKVVGLLSHHRFKTPNQNIMYFPIPGLNFSLTVIHIGLSYDLTSPKWKSTTEE